MPVDLSNVTAYSGDMLRIISDAELSILRRLAARLRAGRGAPDWEQEKLAELRILRRQISQDVAAMDAALVQEVDRLIEAAYQDGAAAAGADLRDAGVEPRRAVALPASVQVLADELALIVAGSAPRILRSVTDAYQQAVAAEVGQLLTGTVTRTQASQAILNRLLGQGITGFTDRSGRQWRLESYVEMATRTAAGNAMTAGHVDRLLQHDSDLVHIIPGPRACGVCDVWAGRVVALSPSGLSNPDVEVTATIEQAEAAGWRHPNCRCTIGIYLPGITETTDQRPDPQGYADQQQQRALERNIRAAKREQALALDGTAAQRATQKVRAAQADLRDHLSTHPELKRQSHRETIGGAVAPVASAPRHDLRKLLKEKDQASPFWDEVDAAVNGAVQKGGLTAKKDTFRHDPWSGSPGGGQLMTYNLDDENGEHKGQLIRSMGVDKNGDVFVMNDMFTLDPAYQGKGIATAMAAQLEKLYADAGVKYIKLHANIDVGGYTWARQGFGWDPSMMSHSYRKITSKLEEAGAAADFVERLKKLPHAEWPTPYDIAMHGWTPGADTWPGKTAMLGSDWPGRKELK